MWSLAIGLKKDSLGKIHGGEKTANETERQINGERERDRQAKIKERERVW